MTNTPIKYSGEAPDPIPQTAEQLLSMIDMVVTEGGQPHRKFDERAKQDLKREVGQEFKVSKFGKLVGNVTGALVGFWETKNPFRFQQELKKVESLKAEVFTDGLAVSQVKNQLYSRWVSLGMSNEQIASLSIAFDSRIRLMERAYKNSSRSINDGIADIVEAERKQKPNQYSQR